MTNRRGETSLLGQTLGPYFIQDRLGQGGMGAVYLAVDRALERKVALKVLLPRHAGDEEFVLRFQREARAAARLNHPNIVQIYAVDIDSDPPYMAMEYVEGQTLEARIRNQGPLSWQKALTVVSQVASALSCAHDAGIIHRDIKPANILLDASGRARVTDFGIAKVLGSQTQLTGTQHTVGSPCYMSPEQCGKGEVTAASDLFSLGIMLFEMLTGKVPFTGESSLAVMKRITEEDLPPLASLVPSIPPAVQQILSTLAARDRQYRYASAAQVLQDLRALQAGGPLQFVQTLALQRAGHAPATESAADLTRSPTGPSPALRTSLVDELIDDSPRKPVPVRRSDGFEIPWTGILATVTVLLLVVLGMVYYKGWELSRRRTIEQPPAAVHPVEEAPLVRGPRNRENRRNLPEEGFRPERRPPGFQPGEGRAPLPPVPPGMAPPPRPPVQ